MVESKRLEYIDLLKGIGIFFVTFAHLSPHIFIEKHIYSFHMFLFFFISGYCHSKPGTLHKYIKKKAVSLLVPFAFWNIVSTAIEILLNGNLTDNLCRMFMINGKITWNAPIWFLWILFLTEILFAVIEHFDSKVIYIVSLLSALVLSFFCRDNYMFKIGILPMAYLFFCFGIIARKINISIRLSRWWGIISFLLLVINLLFSSLLNARISVINCYYGNLVYCFIAAISGIFVYYIIFLKISQSNHFFKAKRLLSYIGTNSKIIMCLQYFVFRGVNVLTLKLFNYDIWHATSTIKAFLFSIFTIIIILLVNRMVKALNCKALNTVIGIR